MKGIPIANLLKSGGRINLTQLQSVSAESERRADEAYTERLIDDGKKQQQQNEHRTETHTIREEPEILNNVKAFKQRYRQLNSSAHKRLYDDPHAFKAYLTEGTYPPYVKTDRQRKAFADKFGRDFYIKGDDIVYETSAYRLLVVPPDKTEKILKDIYSDTAKGLGHGITQFYKIVSDEHLNITRKDCEAFLKRQSDYQLTRKLITPKNPTQKIYRENHTWATDLIDMTKYKQYNNRYNYIMTTQDVFTKKCYLRKLKTKDAKEVVREFSTFMTAENKPKILKSDNGESTSKEFKALLQRHDVRLITTNSHTPQSNIENLNGQIRKFLQHIAVRNKNLVWYDKLDDIEKNINSYNALGRNKRERQLKKEQHKEKIKEGYKDDTKKRLPKFKVGDKVRLSQKAFVPDVRKEYKAGTQKSILVKYSIVPFVVAKVFQPRTSNAFPLYNLQDAEDGQIIKNRENTKAYKARESDLLLVPDGTDGGITLAQNNLLNQIKQGHAPKAKSVSRVATRSKTKEKAD